MKRVLFFLMALIMLESCASSPVEQTPVFPTPPLTNSDSTPIPFTMTVPASAPNATGTALSDNYIVPGEETHLSPDGKWKVFTDNGFEVAHVIISRLDGRKSWDLSFPDITGASSCISYTDQYGDQRCFYGVLHINHWHKNGRYVFVDVDYLIDRWPNFSFGLYRIDSETGQVSPYLPLNDYTYNYAFSQDDEYYSYATGSDNYLLHIVSMETGENTSYVVPGRYEDVGEMLWAPDNERVAIVTHGIGWADKPEVGWSLVMLDVGTGKFATLFPNEGYRLTPIKWLSNDTILLSGRSNDGQEYHDYQLTISTNTLIPLPDVTATP